jgi:Cys-tRNA(Pro) deacylase
MSDDGAARALAAIEATGITFTVTTHGHVNSLQEAAAARGVAPDAVIKTMVVRKGDDDYVLVLVPGDRTIAWPKLRTLLGVSRLSMPDADQAFAATGYRRGTITPFGAQGSWPVIADASLMGRPVSIGGGASGVAFTVDGDALADALDATIADISEAAAPA